MDVLSIQPDPTGCCGNRALWALVSETWALVTALRLLVAETDPSSLMSLKLRVSVIRMERKTWFLKAWHAVDPLQMESRVSVLRRLMASPGSPCAGSPSACLRGEA